MKKIIIKYFIFSSLCLLAFSLTADAQKNMEDVLYLKNGSILRGQVIDQTDSIIRIRLIGGSELVIDTKDISNRTSEKALKPPKYFHNKDKGIYSLSSIGLHHDFESNLDLLIETSLGYQFHPRIAVGVGANLTSYYGNSFIPVFGEIRGEILPKNMVTPIYYGSAGYGFKLDRLDEVWGYEDNGLYYAYGLGVKIKSQSSLNFTFSVGQQVQEFTHTWFTRGNGWDTEDRFVTTEILYSRIQFKFGLGF